MSVSEKIEVLQAELDGAYAEILRLKNEAVESRSEVERLRADLKHLMNTSVKEEVFDIVCKERDTLRTQLAEAHGLLRHLYENNELSLGDDQRILSAIAESNKDGQ